MERLGVWLWILGSTLRMASIRSSRTILRTLPLSERGLFSISVTPYFLKREYQVWMVRQVNWRGWPSSSVKVIWLTALMRAWIELPGARSMAPSTRIFRYTVGLRMNEFALV